MCLANILFAASHSFCDRDGARSFETNTVGIWHVPDTHGFNTNHYMKCFTSNDILSLLSIFCCVFVWIRRMICQDLFSGKVMISSPFLIYPFPNKPTLKMDIKIAMALECYVSNLVYTVCMQFLYFLTMCYRERLEILISTCTNTYIKIGSRSLQHTIKQIYKKNCKQNSLPFRQKDRLKWLKALVGVIK